MVQHDEPRSLNPQLSNVIYLVALLEEFFKSIFGNACVRQKTWPPKKEISGQFTSKKSFRGKLISTRQLRKVCRFRTRKAFGRIFRVYRMLAS